MRFDPPLTRAKLAAIDSINAGTATKLVLCFRRNKKGTTFWPKTTPLLATSLATQLWWPTGWGYDDQRHFLASCLVGGAAVTRFAERDPRRVGLARLAHMFGKERVEGKILSPYYVKSWHADPRIKGAIHPYRLVSIRMHCCGNFFPPKTTPVRNCFSHAIT
jgi:monoamine oxidase